VTGDHVPVHGGDLWGAAARYGGRPEDYLDFSANINPLGPPAAVYQALSANLTSIAHYPDPRARAITAELAAYYNVPKDCILVGNGASEVIRLLGLLRGVRRALVPVPTFAEYEAAMRAAGVGVRYLCLPEENGFAVSGKAITRCCSDIDIIFLCNPNNPTGRLIETDQLHHLVKATRAAGIRLVVDESFLDLVPAGEAMSLIPMVRAAAHLLIVRSLTKAFAIPGLRLGCLVASPAVVTELRERRDPWSVNCLAQAAGVAALHDTGYLRRSREIIARERKYLFHRLNGIPGLRPFPPAANYIFVRIIASGWDSTRLTESLGQRGILIRDCFSYPFLGKRYVRLAVRERQDNDRLLEALAGLLGSPGLDPGSGGG